MWIKLLGFSHINTRKHLIWMDMRKRSISLAVTSCLTYIYKKLNFELTDEYTYKTTMGLC